ncbi:unnamed protein product [Rhizoctonia solani]|uniref:Uncharacterized protein n=1 Tax=Rhizoctonia solani TaxID=456999 RepID=A0A8H3AXN4_9AGAM|nr:unnamed protein product [Rhizoctonia solani]
MASTDPIVSGMRKGKRTSAVLPRVAIRLIIDWTVSVDRGYVPRSLEEWGQQVWIGLHVGRVLCTLRRVSPDEHPTWRTLCMILDPYLVLARPRHHLNPTQVQVPSQPPLNADAFRRIIRATCLVCAVSCPDNRVYRHLMARGPQSPTYPTPSSIWGIIPVCAVHRPLSFCGRCLRSEPATLGLTHYTPPHLALAPLAANERDPEFVRCLDLRTSSGAGVRAVCGACRDERIRTELIRGRGANMAPWMGSGFWDWDYDGTDVWSVPWDGGLSRRDADRLLRSEEVDGVVTQYVEYGDWTVREAIEEMEERVWMRWWTKANEMEGLVRATAKFQRMEERAAEPLDTDDESDEEDDLLSLSDEFGLRDMIFQDWARNRILEGIWLSPHMDINQYHAQASTNPEFRHMPPRWAPRHPFGRVQRTPPTLPRVFHWTISVASRDARDPHDQRRTFTRAQANFYLSNPPPPARLAYSLARAWEQSMRSIIGPAITNIVSRIVKECKVAEEVIQAGIDGLAKREAVYVQCVLAHGEPDPCKAVSRINADRLVELLRRPEPWVEGGGWEDIYVDWEEPDPSMIYEREDQPREREPSLTPSSVAPTLRESVAPSPPPSTISAQSPHPSDLHQSSPSDLQRSSPVSTTPSPEALTSPSTMRTTPSPPPADGKKEEGFVGTAEGAFTPTLSPIQPVSPRLSTSKPLHPIPLIPHCGYHLGQHTKSVLEMLWREATGGLWMCRCTICSRAMSVQGVPSVQQPQSQTQTYHQQPTFYPAQQQQQALPDLQCAPAETWNLEPMQVEEVEGKGKGVAGRRSREREEMEDRGERKRIKCEAAVGIA